MSSMFQGHSTADIIAALTKMVQDMRASNAKRKNIVSHCGRGNPVKTLSE